MVSMKIITFLTRVACIVVMFPKFDLYLECFEVSLPFLWSPVAMETHARHPFIVAMQLVMKTRKGIQNTHISHIIFYIHENGPMKKIQAHIIQTCQLSRVSRESHGFLHFLQSHGRGNSCSRVYSCPTVLFSHRLLPIIIAGNTFWQHKFSVK